MNIDPFKLQKIFGKKYFDTKLGKSRKLRGHIALVPKLGEGLYPRQAHLYNEFNDDQIQPSDKNDDETEKKRPTLGAQLKAKTLEKLVFTPQPGPPPPLPGPSFLTESLVAYPKEEKKEIGGKPPTIKDREQTYNNAVRLYREGGATYDEAKQMFKKKYPEWSFPKKNTLDTFEY